MVSFAFLILVLGFLQLALCDPNLQVIKRVDSVFIPVAFSVEEKIGARFSLLCELVFLPPESGYDNRLYWVKQGDESFLGNISLESLTNNTENRYSYQSTDVNKAVMNFDSLKDDEGGYYVCFSVKYKMYKMIKVIVQSGIKIPEMRYFREPSFCSDQMFKCKSNGVCVIQHYVCDGKADCKDGSDETIEQCNGDPCKDKLHCDDGRCIPTAWCCDRNHDLNCSVTNRPRCCQVLSESYEELEYGPPVYNSSQTNGARYLFVSVCILSILFSIVLLLLILSKVVIFAKKTALQQQAARGALMTARGESITLYDHPGLLRACRNEFLYEDLPPSMGRTRFSNRRIVLDNNCETYDPLLPSYLRVGRGADQPPSYRDAVTGGRVGTAEPPPPYTSREILNDERNA